MHTAMTSLPYIDYAAHPAYGGMLEPDPQLGERALEVLSPLIDEMTRVEAERVEKFGYRYGHSTSAERELVENSFVCGRLPGADMDRIGGAAAPYVDALKDRLKDKIAQGEPIGFKMVNTVLDPNADAAIWTSVNDALREEGLLEMVRVFHGAIWSKLNSLAIFVNPPNWTGPAFRDQSAETPPTAGMHIDSNGKCYLKMILYLNEVGPEQGPTSVVPGSHEWDSGGLERIHRRAFDRSKLLGRKQLDRQKLLSLPKALQVKAEFGGDLLPDSPQTQALLANEFVSTGERGHYTVFNPEAVHRGGAVRSGERIALQITLGARW
jgi:hypothetical protein